MPITRAACTYSLFFSTIVEPRTVRAYCTQFDNPMARISTQHRDLVVRAARQRHARHAVDQERDEDRRERELDVGHAHDERVELAADVAGERGRARRRGPSRTRPRRGRPASEMRAPNMIADSTSRPWSSVPSRNIAWPPLDSTPAAGSASDRFSVRRSNGLWGATHGANSAANDADAGTTASDAIATGEWRKLHATSLSQAERRRAAKRRRRDDRRRDVVHAAIGPGAGVTVQCALARAARACA